jgi:hypothetical protein
MKKRGRKQLELRRKGRGEVNEWPFRVHLDLTSEPPILAAGTDTASLTLDRFGRIGARLSAPDDSQAHTRQLTDVASVKRVVRAIPPAGWLAIGLVLLLVIAWSQR